jgi:hypothetical protein
MAAEWVQTGQVENGGEGEELAVPVQFEIVFQSCCAYFAADEDLHFLLVGIRPMQSLEIE